MMKKIAYAKEHLKNLKFPEIDVDEPMEEEDDIIGEVSNE